MLPTEPREPARQIGDIVPLRALMAPTTFSPELYAARYPADDLQGFRLIRFKAFCGERDHEYWIVETVGGEYDGQQSGAYVYTPGNENP